MKHKGSHKHSPRFAQSKVAEQINRNLAAIIQQKAKDPRLGMININEVKVTRDLSVAKVYFTIISHGEDAANSENQIDNKQTEKLLNNMSGFLRSELATKLTIRSVPELRFYYDTVIETSKHIEDLFEQIKKQDQ